MVITQSDSLRTATAANVYAYAIASERSMATGKTTETQRIERESANAPNGTQIQMPTSAQLEYAEQLRSERVSQLSKALKQYAGYDLRHSCYLSILV